MENTLTLAALKIRKRDLDSAQAVARHAQSACALV